MLKKTIKIIIILFMLLGISFSVFNFLSLRLDAGTGGGDKGIWNPDTEECEGYPITCNSRMEQ